MFDCKSNNSVLLQLVEIKGNRTNIKNMITNCVYYAAFIHKKKIEFSKSGKS